MRNSLPVGSFAVTVESADDWTAQRDRVVRQARAASDEFIRRDAGNFARLTGRREFTISRQRQNLDDVTPETANVAGMVEAGRALGRTFADLDAYLLPITTAARADLVPWGECIETLPEVLPAVADLIREAGEALACVIERAPGGFTAREAVESVKEIDDVMERCRLAKLAIQAAAALNNPRRGKAFAQATKSRT